MLLHHIFETQARQTPSALAVKSDSKTYSYQQIDEQANKIANSLVHRGITNGKFVGIYFSRSERPIIAMLGILKAGCAYVPIDRSFPSERITHIVQDASISLMLTENNLMEELSQCGNLECIDISSILVSSESISNDYLSKISIIPENLTYLIYTSGSTGKPKGVMTTHANVVHFVKSFKNVCRLSPEDRIYNGFAYSFDGSVEEIWMAFSSGASLIVANDEQAKQATEAEKLIHNEGVTFLSTVPTMLRLMSDRMDSLRLIILSGEPCTPDLVDKWADKCRLLNVYGPTETTVNATYWECRRNTPIVIGQALEGYPTFILDKDYTPVSKGEKGELFIGGLGLAKGYLNQEELTAKTFIKGIIDGETLYRTGDLVSLNDDEEIVFHGRIDSQVKVRGFRIELSEIETVISESDQIESVAVETVSPKTMTELAAYIVLKNPNQTFDSDELLKQVQQKLPSYMVPSYLEIIPSMPRLTSGKINRKALPKEPQAWMIQNRDITAPRTTAEKKVAAVWQQVLQPHSLSVTDDFFEDLRGDSLFAAVVATVMREKRMEIAIRDIYQSRTIEKLALIVEQNETKQTHTGAKNNNISRESSFAALFKTLQFIAQYLINGVLVFPVAMGCLIYLQTNIPLWAIVIIFGVTTYPLMLITSIISKWIIIGKYKTGEYPLYGEYFFRWWLVDRITQKAMPQLLAGSPLMNLYYRAMGAKIGEGAIIDTHLCSAWDLIEIGDNASIGNETQIMGSTVEHKTLKIGKIKIGEDCSVGIHSCLEINTTMERSSILGDISLLSEGETLQSYSQKQGSPAVDYEMKLSTGKRYKSKPILWCIVYALAFIIIELFITLSSVPSLLLILTGLSSTSTAHLIAMIFLAAPTFVISFCLLAVISNRLLLPNLKEGTYKVESFFFVRKWIADSIIRLSVILVKPVYTTIFLPNWLRLLGAKIGKRAEISTVSQISPELVEIGDESFFADGSIIGGRRFHRGYVEISKTRIGNRSFIGNSAILPVGTSIGNESLIGVLSVPPLAEGTIPNGTDWLGSPSFNLPLRQKIDGFSDEQIYCPTAKLYALRYLIDSIRIIVPALLEVVSGLLLFYYSYELMEISLWWAIPFVMIILSIANVLLVVLYKWIFMGRIPSTIKPLWCDFVWRNEAVNGAYESVMTNATSGLIGTPFLAPFLRLLGCKIGRNAYIGSMLMSEFDLVHIGDDVTINAGVVLQNHLFEDRIMKASTLFVNDGCSIGNMSIVLYDAIIEKGTRLESLSLVMKNEKLPQNSIWRGIPCVRV